MNIGEKIKFLSNPKMLALFIIRNKPVCYILSDKCAIRLMYRIKMGKKLNLSHPHTYNEKIQWLKLYGFKNEYTKLADKIEVRDFVKDRIGEQYLIPLIGTWDKIDDVGFESLPSKFVLKGAQNGVFICKDKSKTSYNEIKQIFDKYAKYNFFYLGREPVYKSIRPRVLCEKYMENENEDVLLDYKFFCHDGVVDALYVASDRGEGTTRFDFYDTEFNHLDFKQHYPNADTPPLKPKHFEEMKELASKLSKGFQHIRVDLYEINDRVYFSEMTFYHLSGFEVFEPEKWDVVFGEMIQLQSFSCKDGSIK